MMHITQMLTFCGTLYLIFLTGIASSMNETLSEELQCIKPISYKMKIFPLIQNNSLNIETRVKINVSCLQSPIKLKFGRYCDAPEINGFSNNKLRRDNLTSLVWTTSVSFFTKDQFKILLIRVFQVNRKLLELSPRITYLKTGIYWINAVYNCSLDKVATVFSYVQQSEETQYLILPRIPNEWIFPLWKNPAIKATFRIRIYHTNDEKAFSHMAGDTKIEKNTSCTYFPSTSVMSTHLVAIAVVPSTVATSFYFFKKNIIINRVQMNSKLSYAQSLITTIKHHVMNTWKDVLWSRVIYAALPINSSHYESVITKNHVFFNEAEITYDEEIDSLAQKKTVTCLVARNVIQEMFSDWLPSLKQSDSWFMGGFSTFYGVYIIDQMCGHSLLKSLIVQTRRETLDFIEAYTTHNIPVKEISPFISPSSIFIELWRKSALSIFYMVTDIDKHVLYNSMFREAINIHHNTVFHVNNSYIAWYPVFTAFEYLSKIFPFPESTYIKYRILAVLNKFLEDSSHTPSSENNVTNQLYFEVLKWTCILDGLKCKDIVMAEFKWHVQDLDKHKLLPSWQKWIFCQTVIVENSYYTFTVWITLMHMYKEQSKVEELFKVVLCSRHTTNFLLTLSSLLNYSLPLNGYNFTIKESDRITFLYNTIAKHIQSVESLTSLLHVIESIKERRNINIAAIVTCIINHVYSDEILAKVTDENLFQKLMNLHRTPSFVIDAIEKKVITRRNFLGDIRYNLRQKPHDAIYRYLVHVYFFFT
ncbi:uncharacterized protein LOC109861440 isoform X3 [Pseudomyrmex gracilis]|uniref:uncharacterized protein LOC109861440 isoform X3 n=1 Tax=Pseudomyrmex gracilis TaxID=219809 RepID=UPI000994F7CE|nr:uncharacterized protein LOC109861440 isoform X3 [Pseudomyrmex gracilis]